MTGTSAAWHDNASLFDTIQAPVKRTSKDSARRRSVPVPVANDREDYEVPQWAMVPPIQQFISYIDRSGSSKRLRVVPYLDLQTQDMELKATIKDILDHGGRNLLIDVIAVKTGVCVSRWSVG